MKNDFRNMFTLPASGMMTGSAGIIDENGFFHPKTCFTAGTLVIRLKTAPKEGIKETSQIKGSVSASLAAVRNIQDKQTAPFFETESVPIEKIKVGDYAASYNEKTGRKEYKKVTELYYHEVKLLYRLVLKTGTVIETTWNHPFFVVREEKANASTVHRGGWTKARFLKTGDVLLTESGRLLQLESSRQVHSSKPVPVYNFEVEDNHSYFVSNDGVLVHNYDRDEIQSAKNTLLSGLAIREKLIKEGRPVPENLTKIINDAAKVAFSKPDSFEGSMNSFGKGVLGDLLETPSQARRLLDPNYIGSQSAENVKDVLNPAEKSVLKES